MIVTLTGILAAFFPGIIGYGVVCWMMPCKEVVNRLFRAVLIVAVTCGLGFVGGYTFFIARDPGPYDDGWHRSCAGIFAAVQFVVGIVLGVLSLIRENGGSRDAVPMTKHEKDQRPVHELGKKIEIDT